MRPAVNPRQLCAVFLRRAWIIALAAVLAIGGAVSHLVTRPPQYQAEASILITPDGIAPAVRAHPELAAIRLAYRETVLNDVAQLVRSRTLSEQAAGQVGGITAEEIAHHVTVRGIPRTDFLLIRAVDTQPERAALMANALAQQLGSFYVQMYQAGLTGARQFIDEQLRLAQDRRGATEQAMFEFQARTGTVALADELSRSQQRMLDLQAAYEGATLDETTARTRVAAIRAHLAAQNDAPLASLSIATNPVVAQIRDHLTGLELQLADLRQTYTDEHPAVKSLLGKIAVDRERLGAEAAKVLNDKSLGISPAREQFVREMIDGEVDAAAARAKAAGIHSMLDKLQARLSSVPDNVLTLARLQRDARDAEQLVTRLAALQQDAVMRESQAVASGQNAIVVVDQAMAPSRPIPLPFPQAAAGAALLGLCLGAGLALAVEGAEKRIRAMRRRRAAAGTPGLVPIPSLIGLLNYRYVTAALGMAIVLLAVALAVHFSAVGQALLAQAVYSLHGLYVAQVKAVPVNVAHVGQALMRVFSAVQ